MEVFFAIIITALVTLGIVTIVKQYCTKQKVNAQSIVLLDKIKRVCKFITVEGDFAEIYHYEDVKEKFLKLISSRKKALVVINAKAHIGFDLEKLKLHADENSKRIILMQFPQPEILSIETNLRYYDKKDGIFNKFEAADLTDLHDNAKQHIAEKVPQSGLYNTARLEALEAIKVIESIVETIGWSLDYTALQLSSDEQKLLD